MPTWPSPRSEQLGTPNPPRNPFHAGQVFRGFPIHAFATACQVARSPVRIRPTRSAPGSFYFQASNGSVALPVAGYDYNSDWTPLLAGLSPARMAASLAAPDPYMRLSLIRLLPRVRTHHQIHDDTHAAIACDMLNPAQCPEHALMARIPLGLGPSLHQLRSRSLCLVRRLHSYYGLVRLPTPVHHRLRLLAFPMRTAVRESELSTDGQTWDIPGSDAIHLRVMCVAGFAQALAEGGGHIQI